VSRVNIDVINVLLGPHGKKQLITILDNFVLKKKLVS